MSLQAMPLNQLYQPFSNEQLADPYPIYALARQQQPIFYTEELLPDTGVYVVTSYDDIIQINAQPDLFVSKDAVRSVVTIYPETLAELAKGYYLEHAANSEGLDHRRMRIPFNKAFAAPRVRLLEPFIYECANALIDAIATTSHAEMISQFCGPLPLQVVLHLFEIPQEDMTQAREWCDESAALINTPLSRERQVECARNIVKFHHYLGDLITERRANPRENDFLTDLIEYAEPGLESLGHTVRIVASMIVAYETTMNLIGNGLRILLEPRERWQVICQHPAQIPQTVEEILRYDSPVQTIFRTAAREAEVGGVTVPEGALLLLVYGSANRDETKFGHADQFDPQELRENKLLSFGHGRHQCVGAALGRTEGRIAFELLSQRFPHLRLASPQHFEHKKSLLHRGYRSIFVEW
jgi:cytochrome P450